MLNQEIWKDIQEFKGKYQVSSFGNIRNVRTGKELKGINKDGYLTVFLYFSKNQSKKFRIHRIVAEHFIENFELKMSVNHKDSDKKNNHFENLEWVTHSENMQHARDNNLMDYSKLRGERNKSSKLKESDILSIRESFKNGVKVKNIAEKFFISTTLVYKIIKKELWRHL